MYKAVVTGADLLHIEKEREVLSGIAEIIEDKSNNREELVSLISNADAIMIDVDTILDRELLSSCKNLKVVVEYGGGVDNIDIRACTEFGIYVCNVPDIFVNEVSEFTIGLIFSIGKEITRASIDVKQKGIWNANNYVPRLFSEKTLGIIGFGRIGQKIARLSYSFFNNILVYDPYASIDESEFVNLKIVNFEEILKNSDILSINVPLNELTRGLLGAQEFKKMKNGVFLVNTSRGAVIDEKSIIRYLSNGKVTGAGLDVSAIEPIKRDNPLLLMENVIITPHMAWKSEDSKLRIELAVANTVKDVLTGKKPVNLINKELLNKG